MIRIAVAEDEAACVLQIKQYLSDFQAETGRELSVDYYPDGQQLLEACPSDYNILMLDIEMPRLDGISAARRIREMDREVTIVFITRMAQYALNGYEVQALDFLLKPVRYPVLKAKLERIIDQIEARRERCLLLSTREGVQRLALSKIRYIEIINHQSFVHYENQIFKSSGTLKKWEDELCDPAFVRCNSGILVNLRHVTQVKKNIAVVGGEEVPISRPRRKEFLKEIADYVGRVHK